MRSNALWPIMTGLAHNYANLRLVAVLECKK